MWVLRAFRMQEAILCIQCRDYWDPQVLFALGPKPDVPYEKAPRPPWLGHLVSVTLLDLSHTLGSQSQFGDQKNWSAFGEGLGKGVDRH